MFQSWVLDLIIRDGVMDAGQPDLKSGMWLIISADGIPRPFATTECEYSHTPSWNFPARLVLQFGNIQRAYLYVTLCTHGETANLVNCIGRSRIGLRSLPIGSPKTFHFPLMEPLNAANSVMTLRITATLSSL